MSTGVPRKYNEVVREAKKLGYLYHSSTGGHDFYVKAHPDEDLGQVKKLVIPTDIKTEKTLRSILNGMGYFTANNLDHAGHPIPPAKPDPAVEQKRAQSQFVHNMRDWKTQMKRYTRGIVEYPGHAPERPPAPKA